jgi:hypothetical protein
VITALVTGSQNPRKLGGLCDSLQRRQQRRARGRGLLGVAVSGHASAAAAFAATNRPPLVPGLPLRRLQLLGCRQARSTSPTRLRAMTSTSSPSPGCGLVATRRAQASVRLESCFARTASMRQHDSGRSVRQGGIPIARFGLGYGDAARLLIVPAALRGTPRCR